MAKTVLVVGGAGYVGSHAVAELASVGYNVIVLDNLSKGHAEAIYSAKLIQGDINDTALLNKIFQENEISTVMHFAGSIEVGESVVDPRKYYYNNVCATLNLLSAMIDNNVKSFIFSSTCAICGDPVYLPLDEEHPQNPVNPYGMTKLMV
jgi:UDP-glucose 4-epimerase